MVLPSLTMLQQYLSWIVFSFTCILPYQIDSSFDIVVGINNSYQYSFMAKKHHIDKLIKIITSDMIDQLV